jgi:hypothetical protein
MQLFSAHRDLRQLNDRLHDAPAMTADLMSEVIGRTSRRFSSAIRDGKTAQLARLIESGAWTDAALALIELELPAWQPRRIAYDDGEWHCALSRQRDLPDWLDQSIEADHADLPLAILGAYIGALRQTEAVKEINRPIVPQVKADPYEHLCCENFA